MSSDSKPKGTGGLNGSASIPLKFDPEPNGILNQRTHHIKTQSASNLALSMLDLCYMTWLVPSNSRSLLRQTTILEQSEYHHAQGLDLGSAANVAAFMSRYVTARKQENTIAIKPKLCMFCCYDAFTGVDLRIEIAFPGSIDTYVIDSKGQRRNSTDQDWPRTRLASALAFNCHGLQNKQQLLWPSSWGLRNSVFQLLYTGLLQHHMTQEAESMCRQLASHLPAAEALAVQASLATNCAPSRLTSTARSADASKRFARVSAATELKDAAVLYHQSRMLLHHADNLEAALAIAQCSVALGDSHPWLWFHLASVHARKGNIASSLASLNAVSPSQLLSFTVPATASLDRSVFVDPVRSVTGKLRGQDASKDATVQIPFHDDRILAKLPAAQIPVVLEPAYQVLLELQQKHGWKELQSCRSQLFRTSTAASQDQSTESLSDLETRPRPMQQWLDNLFHMLQDDLTMGAKIKQGLEDPKTFTKMDWYRYGRLAQRMQHHDNAHSCYHHCLAQCQSLSSLRLKALVHLLAINTERKDVDDFVSTLAGLEAMVADVPADWRGSVSQHHAVVQGLRLAANVGAQRLINAIKAASDDATPEQCRSTQDAVLAALLRKVAPP
eukprot:TRINITY_DN11271_c0_g1_i1.p1 TRINITY_DN11271_c0_g1~~TRINITY_DN11271_c0_g1_i1.p1  ORF type:complete len:613 (+),score=148.64 TRINITY_DN11271_c0_g1_i1:67-1905(+)